MLPESFLALRPVESISCRATILVCCDCCDFGRYCDYFVFDDDYYYFYYFHDYCSFYLACSIGLLFAVPSTWQPKFWSFCLSYLLPKS